MFIGHVRTSSMTQAELRDHQITVSSTPVRNDSNRCMSIDRSISLTLLLSQKSHMYIHDIEIYERLSLFVTRLSLHNTTFSENPHIYLCIVWFPSKVIYYRASMLREIDITGGLIFS